MWPGRAPTHHWCDVSKSEQVLQAELHLSGNRISRARNASERRRAVVPVRRQEVRCIGDVEHLDAELDTPGSGLAQRLAEREVHAALRRPGQWRGVGVA